MRPILAAILCATLGAAYAWNLGAGTRQRERDCREAEAKAADALEDAESYLTAARARLEWSRQVVEQEAGRCSWWARSCR
jgi:hypothetical protein